MAKPALGRGLGALLGGVPAASKPAPLTTPIATAPPVPPIDGRERVERVAISRIHPCPFQPRKDFPAEALRELADSILAQGIVQPLTVRPRGNDYELIAGERRWRAAQLAGLTEVPVLVRAADDAAVLELALIENLQRENLNPIEEAQGYQQLIEQFKLRQEDAATKVGKSRVVVANALRLLRLPTAVQGFLRQGQIAVGHAKAILGLPQPEDQQLAAERIVEGGLNVRQTEALVTEWQRHGVPGAAAKPAATKTTTPPDIHVAAVQTRLQERFGTRVHVRYRQGKGAVEIQFFSDAEFERILQVAGVSVD